MSLIKCTGCGHEVPDDATVCPTCGAPLTPIPESVRAARPGGALSGVGFALVALGIVTGLISNRILGSLLALAGVGVLLLGRKNRG
jgi:zinc ribbon protein